MKMRIKKKNAEVTYDADFTIFRHAQIHGSRDIPVGLTSDRQIRKALGVYTLYRSALESVLITMLVQLPNDVRQMMREQLENMEKESDTHG